MLVVMFCWGARGSGKWFSYAGTLEASNVNVVEEMVSMIETQRAYEVNSKVLPLLMECCDF